MVSTVAISTVYRGREIEKNLEGLKGLSDRKEVQQRRILWEKSMDTKGGRGEIGAPKMVC